MGCKEHQINGQTDRQTENHNYIYIYIDEPWRVGTHSKPDLRCEHCQFNSSTEISDFKMRTDDTLGRCWALGKSSYIKLLQI